jgi:hypothetical protein
LGEPIKKSPARITERGSRADLEAGETNLQAKDILAQVKIKRCDGYHISYSHRESVNNSTGLRGQDDHNCNAGV